MEEKKIYCNYFFRFIEKNERGESPCDKCVIRCIRSNDKLERDWTDRPSLVRECQRNKQIAKDEKFEYEVLNGKTLKQIANENRNRKGTSHKKDAKDR